MLPSHAPVRDLHLHYIEKFEISPFLLEAQHVALLGAVRRLAMAVGKAPENWTEGDQRAIAAYTEPLNLGSYFAGWAGWQEPQRQQAAGSMMAFFRRVADQKLFSRFKLRPNFADLWRRLAAGGASADQPADSRRQANQPKTALRRHQRQRGANSRKASKQPAWESGMRVRHTTWGMGTVINVLHTFSPPAVWVRFDERRGPKRFPADSTSCVGLNHRLQIIQIKALAWGHNLHIYFGRHQTGVLGKALRRHR